MFPWIQRVNHVFRLVCTFIGVANRSIASSRRNATRKDRPFPTRFGNRKLDIGGAIFDEGRHAGAGGNRRFGYHRFYRCVSDFFRFFLSHFCLRTFRQYFNGYGKQKDDSSSTICDVSNRAHCINGNFPVARCVTYVSISWTVDNK